MNESRYTDLNAASIDKWTADGWEWGRPISHEVYEKATRGEWSVLLTPTKPVPKEWFPPMHGARILGLASGGGQQMPVFTALGANCTVLDYSPAQLDSERLVAEREGYSIDIVRADMTMPLPFAENSFDLIFHPVSNCYVENVLPIWKECYRVLKPGGTLLAGLDNGINFVYDDEETRLTHVLPFNPLRDPALYQESVECDWGIQFSHTVEEQIGGQLAAGFRLLDIYGDTNSFGNLYDFNIPTFWATRSVKE